MKFRLVLLKNLYNQKPQIFENFLTGLESLESSGIDKNKKVAMFCTGGIRCEKASSLMKAKGF